MRGVVVWLALLLAACGGSPDEIREVWRGAPIEPLDLRASLSARAVPLLGTVVCTIDLYAGEGSEPAFDPKVPDGFRGDVQQAFERPLGKGTWQRYEMTLRPTKLGALVVPPFKIEAAGAVATTRELEIEVTTVLRDAGPEVEAPAPPFPPRASPWPVMLGGTALLGLLAVVWWWLRRKRDAPHALQTPLPAHAKALRALARLRQAPRTTPAQIEAFYVEVSQILRVYLERRFGMHAPERTTEEFLTEMSSDAVLTGAQRTDIKRFLTQCDLVKFARAIPTEEVHEATFQFAETFVQSTRADATPHARSDATTREGAA